MRCADFRDKLSPHLLREGVPPVPVALRPAGTAITYTPMARSLFAAFKAATLYASASVG